MTSSYPSPFARPTPGVRIKEGVPPIHRPTKAEMAAFPDEARSLLESTWQQQAPLVESGNYQLDWTAGKHFLLAGATGPGLGGALATALLHTIANQGGSLTVVGRDLSRSVGYETGLAMQAQAEAAGFGSRFHWLNEGLTLDGAPLEKLVAALREAGADRVIYVNTVAAASSGLLPGMPSVYVKDVDDEGLFQWKLPPLDERSIESTRFIMGTMAAQFPQALEAAGIGVEASVFADWRGSLDKVSRDPHAKEYGRQGAYSTSLFLPKDEIQTATAEAYGSGRRVMDIFFPMMRTRALSFIPGGNFVANVYGTVLARSGVRRLEVPELAISALDQIGRSVNGEDDNPFPHLDSHEMPYDLWFYEITQRLNNDENSDFYYKHWMQ